MGVESEWSDPQAIRDETRRRRPDDFSLADDILLFADRFPSTAQVQTSRNPEMAHRYWHYAIVAAASRLYRAISILCESGMSREGHVVARALLELAANQVHLDTDPEKHAVDLLHHSLELKSLLGDRGHLYDLYEEGQWPELQASFSEQRSGLTRTIGEASRSWSGEFRPFGIQSWKRIKSAGLLWQYDLLYFVASDIIHGGPMSIEWHVGWNENDQALTREGPEFVAAVLPVASDLMLRILLRAEDVLHDGGEDALIKLAKRYWAAHVEEKDVPFGDWFKTLKEPSSPPE